MTSRSGARALLLAALLPALGCAHRHPSRYSSVRLARDSRKDPSRALMRYLAQPSAGATVCDLDGSTPHIARIDEEVLDDLIDALDDGRIAPDTWRQCNLLLFPHLTPDQATEYTPGLAELFTKRLEDADSDPARAAQLSAVSAVLAGRPVAAESTSAAATLQPAASRLHSALAEKRLGPVATGLARELLLTLDFELGQLDGQPVTAALIAQIADEAVLRRLMARLPDSALRALSRERLIEVRVAASSRPEVRAHAEEVVAALARTGRWAPDLAIHPVKRAWFNPSAFGSRSILVRQEVLAGQAALLTASGTELLSAVPLSGELLFDLEGFEQPVTLCGPAEQLLLEPCVEATRLSLGNPAAHLDGDGVMCTAGSLPITDAIALAERGAGFLLAPSLGGSALTQLELPIRFERPPGVLLGPESGMRGPDLRVTVQPKGERLLFEVARLPAQTGLRFVLEKVDAAEFVLASVGAVGAQGMAGRRGTYGTNGWHGMRAMCPSSHGGRGGNGGPGGRGGDGGPGGNGWDGGNVEVELICGDGCPELVELVKPIVQSRGGAGGHGGQGGMGGSGGQAGMGGSGSICYANGRSSYVSGGMSGIRGTDGPRGSDGPPGSPGKPGTVRIEVR